MRSIALFTTTRAEFGILSPLIAAIENNKDLIPLLFVGGTHLSKNHGYTIKEIRGQKFKINGTFDYLLDKYDSYSLSIGLSKASKKLATLFKTHDFDFVCVVGDRYELLPIISNAILFKKPVIHIHGGERSEGVIDEQVRHMITKAAHLHFVSCENYADNIRKMGEPKWRIYNTGALGVDNIINIETIPKNDLFEELGLDKSKPVALMTYHPVTLEFTTQPLVQIQNIFSALKEFNLQLIITSSNIEVGYDQIASKIYKHVKNNPDYIFTESLGIKKYLNLIKYCEFVIGNSSSGIIEVPFFKIPTINIGDRQDGRIRHKSVIDTDYSTESIQKGITTALSKEFRKNIMHMEYLFGDGSAAKKMVEIISKIQIDQKLLRKKLEFID